ncbi:PEPxxWA-CTERM sorting domain-containing protein [Phenylobacterium sp.]|jgi:hypothetical protein|uniref:PEPxxWA-CTERM sorting domain-containing protein n=1 Tax=Phenylobacterium sp. TaxID=1871053 RepID=UPI0037C5490B
MINRSVLAAATLALTAAPAAHAAIIIEMGPAAGALEETLYFDGSTGTTLTGLTDPLGEDVSVSGGEALLGIANRSRVTAATGLLDTSFTFRGNTAQTLAFDLASPSRVFTATEFFVFRGRGTATKAILTFVDTEGTAYQRAFDFLGSGGRFNAGVTGGTKIDYFTLAFNGSVQDVRNVYFGGFGSLGAIPEPAAWGMMIVGFAGVGAALRGRRRFVTN